MPRPTSNASGANARIAPGTIEAITGALEQHESPSKILEQIQEGLAESGADVMVLETGLKQPEAIALYESSGYQPVQGYGYYRDSPLVR